MERSLTSALPQDSGLTVQTKEGEVTGSLVSPTVRQFLGIRYATAGRWEAPTSVPPRSVTLNTVFGDSCPQKMDHHGIRFLELSGGSTAPVPESDDCLNLNIWSPSMSRKQSTAVLLWIYGGAFQIGTTNFNFYNGANFVRDNEDLIVVTINYRTNIFGQPNAPQLVSPTQSQNFGLLDVEAAIKWVYDNIEAFGGDRERITIFGQSAGSAIVDAYAYAHPSDTMVKGIITMSGTTILITSTITPTPPRPVGVDWNQIANDVGCGTTADNRQLACMRAVDSRELEQAVIARGTTFRPIVDDITVFSDYRERAKAGNFLRVPMLGGTTAHEADLLILASQPDNTGTISPVVPDPLPGSDHLTAVRFTCPARTAALDRSRAGLPTWRYQYQAIYPNLQGDPRLRSYHVSDVPLVFGTYNDSTIPGEPTANQIALSRYMQSVWAAFAKDPDNALDNPPFSWPRVNSGGNNIVLLGNEANPTGATFAKSSEIDPDCDNIPTLAEMYDTLSIKDSLI